MIGRCPYVNLTIHYMRGDSTMQLLGTCVLPMGSHDQQRLLKCIRVSNGTLRTICRRLSFEQNILVTYTVYYRVHHTFVNAKLETSQVPCYGEENISTDGTNSKVF